MDYKQAMAIGFAQECLRVRLADMNETYESMIRQRDEFEALFYDCYLHAIEKFETLEDET